MQWRTGEGWVAFAAVVLSLLLSFLVLLLLLLVLLSCDFIPTGVRCAAVDVVDGVVGGIAVVVVCGGVCWCWCWCWCWCYCSSLLLGRVAVVTAVADIVETRSVPPVLLPMIQLNI